MKLSEYILEHIKEMHIDGEANLVLNCPNEGSITVAQIIADDHTQNTDTILLSGGSGAEQLFNLGILKTNLLTDDGIRIEIDEIRAKDGDGLKLYDDGGNGIFVEDGGKVYLTNKLNIETNSGALTAGYGCIATALGAVAFGYESEATGLYSFAGGAQAVAQNQSAFAFGFQAVATGMYSVAMGRDIEAGNNYVVAIGLDNMNGLVCNQANSMCIMGGKVGIDTASPEEKLDIRGSVIAKEGFATKLWDVVGGHFETAITGVEYYSPNQHGRIYGTIYRQYHGVKTNGQTLTTTGIERLIDFGGMMNGDMTYRGHTHSGSEYIWVHREINSVQFNVSGWNIDDGWVDYAKV